MQIQPHFLFNTLNSICELIHDEPEAAELMVAQLGDLLRMTMASDGRQEVPLSRELDLVGAYLEIERTRFQDRLSVKKQVDPDVLDALVPIADPAAAGGERRAARAEPPRGAGHGDAHRAPRGRPAAHHRARRRARPAAAGASGASGWASATRARGCGRRTATRHRFELADAPGGGTLVMIEIP